jgi:hypothetical protein
MRRTFILPICNQRFTLPTISEESDISSLKCFGHCFSISFGTKFPPFRLPLISCSRWRNWQLLFLDQLSKVCSHSDPKSITQITPTWVRDIYLWIRSHLNRSNYWFGSSNPRVSIQRTVLRAIILQSEKSWGAFSIFTEVWDNQWPH